MLMRDHRYNLIKPMIESGSILSFNDIFKYIPKTIVARDLGKKVDRFSELMKKVEGFTIGEIYTIAKFCNITESQIYQLIENEYFKTKSRITKI
jgi:hypothetical protein